MYMKAGETVNVSMQMSAGTFQSRDAKLDLLDMNGAVVASQATKPYGTYDATLTYSAPSSGYYRLNASAYFQELGAFKLSIQ
jgi:hypothetical protein